MSGECSDSEEPVVVNNRFANDGSFLELFKQMQRNNDNKSSAITCIASANTSNTSNTRIDSTLTPHNTHSTLTHDKESHNSQTTTECTTSEDITTNTTSTKSYVSIAKRRPKTLKTGLIVKKQKTDSASREERDGEPTDAWNRYMREVREYKEKYGDDNDKNRPLVK